MRRLAQTVALLSVPLAFAACGDDVQRSLVAPIVPMDGGIPETGSGGGDAGCPSATFLSPVANASLTAANDKNGDSCADGFQSDVELAVGAPDGTPVTLIVNQQVVAGPVLVSGAFVRFPNVQLPSQGAATLFAQIGSAGCSASAMIAIDCGVPTCSVTKPALSAGKPKLNSADRSSSPGAPFQVAFEITTNVADGQPVRLVVARKDNPSVATTLEGVAMGGKAAFSPTLSPLNAAAEDPAIATPDTVFEVFATCQDAKGVVGISAKADYAVDVTPPALTVTDPPSGTFFGPPDSQSEFKLNAQNQFNVCATTTAAHADATNLPDVLAKALNLCVRRGMAAETCVKMGEAAMKTCIPVTCPGGTPFDLTMTLTDAAGNVSTQTITQIACASELPTVEIVAPVSDNDFTDPTKRLLAANADQVFKDLDPNTNGAQTNVVACTDKAGASAELLVGLAGGQLDKVGTTVSVEQATQGECADTNLGFVAKWTGVTLPESSVNTSGTLLAATILRVKVTDSSTAENTSDPTQVWVDSSAPVIAFLTPSAAVLCDTKPSSVDITSEPIRFALNQPVLSTVLTVTNDGSGAVSYDTPVVSGLQLQFNNVVFRLGSNVVTAIATDVSGNRGALASTCQFRVGEVPVLTWLEPAPSQNLCAASNNTGTCVPDADAGTPGWQGTLKVRVDLSAMPATSGEVVFRVGDADQPAVNIGANGEATLANLTIPDGTAVTLRATTSDLNGTGPGLAVRTVIVDSVPPAAPTELLITEKNRRETSFTAAWKAPDDGGKAAAGYDLRWSNAGMSPADYTTAQPVVFSGAPQAPGGTDQIDVSGLFIERDYHFGIVAVDAVGNRSPLASTMQPVRASFRTAVFSLESPRTNERFGAAVDGSADLDGDGFFDVVVGSAGSNSDNVVGRMAILWGASTTSLQTAANRRKTLIVPSNADTAFGTDVAVIDVDGDGNRDIAVSTLVGKVVVIKGRTPAQWAGLKDGTLGLSPTDVYEITGTSVGWGESLSSVGDFDGDSRPDFVVSGVRANGNQGSVEIILGESGGFTGANRIVINGTSATFFMGRPTLGVGRYYPGGGSTFLATATFDPKSPERYGRVFAFHGLAPGQAYTIADAKASVGGPQVTSGLFGQALVSLGALGGGRFGLGAGSYAAALPGTFGRGYVSLSLSTVAEGPLSSQSVRVSSSATAASPDYFAQIAFGSVLEGTNVALPFVGDTRDTALGDLVVVSRSESGGQPGSVYIYDGAAISAANGDVDLASGATVRLPLANYVADWKLASFFQVTGGLIRDFDGDGWADFAVGEYLNDAQNPLPGRTIVFW